MNVNEYGKMTPEKVAEHRTLEEAIRRFGVEDQTSRLLGATAELQKEICKTAGDTCRIVEEIADIEIMLEQLKISYGIAEIVASERRMKVNRLEERMKGGT